MFGHFVNRMLMKGGGSSGGGGGGGGLGDGGGRAANQGGMGGSSSGGSRGGGGPGRDTPGSPNAADGRRGASMGSIGGSAPGVGGGGTNPGRPGGESGERSLSGPDTSAGTNPGRPGGESGQRSMTVGSESISGSGNARSSFSFNTSRFQPSMSTISNVRSPSFSSPSSSFRANRQLSVNSPNTNIASQPAFDAIAPTSPDYRDADYERAMADRASVQPATRDRYERQGLSVVNENQPEMNTSLLGPTLGGLLAVGQNALAGRKTANQLSELEAEKNLPDTFFSNDAADYASAYGAERLANVPVVGGLIGDSQAAERAMMGAYNPPEPNLPEGGGGDEPYIPPQPPVGPPQPPVGPPLEQEPQTQERWPGVGRLRNYNSYARRFFSQV